MHPLTLTLTCTLYFSHRYYPAANVAANYDDDTVFINLASVPALRAVTVDSTGTRFTFGAAATLSTLIATLKSALKNRVVHQTGFGTAAPESSGPTDSTLSPLNGDLLAAALHHLNLVAHWQVRDQACWAGNLMLARNHPKFASDVMIVLATLGAVVQVASGSGSTIVTKSITDLVDPTHKVIPLLPSSTHPHPSSR
jgi:hypothetical protein